MAFKKFVERESLLMEEGGVNFVFCSTIFRRRDRSFESPKEIAAALQITEGTAKGHVNIILTKLGVIDRTQAATTALQRGILHLE